MNFWKRMTYLQMKLRRNGKEHKCSCDKRDFVGEEYMRYTIKTGQFEKGTQAQQTAFVQLFGAENIQYKFDFYFHWYNIIHEYGHCLCIYYGSSIHDLKQEFLVNRFAVSIWRYAGYEKELKSLQKMLGETLQKMKNPVPEDMSFTDYYEQLWGTDVIMEVPIYGYLQFKSVLMALEGSDELTPVLAEMGIHKKIDNCCPFHKKYSISAQTAIEALNDIRHLLDSLGIEQPIVDIELVDDPSIHCVRYIDTLD